MAKDYLGNDIHIGDAVLSFGGGYPMRGIVEKVNPERSRINMSVDNSFKENGVSRPFHVTNLANDRMVVVDIKKNKAVVLHSIENMEL